MCREMNGIQDCRQSDKWRILFLVELRNYSINKQISIERFDGMLKNHPVLN